MKKNDIWILWTTFFLWQKMKQSQSAKGEGYRQQKIEVALIQQDELKKKKKVFPNLPGWMVKLVYTVCCALTTQFLLFVSYRPMKANLVFKLDQFSFLNELR